MLEVIQTIYRKSVVNRLQPFHKRRLLLLLCVVKMQISKELKGKETDRPSCAALMRRFQGGRLGMSMSSCCVTSASDSLSEAGGKCCNGLRASCFLLSITCRQRGKLMNEKKKHFAQACFGSSMKRVLRSCSDLPASFILPAQRRSKSQEATPEQKSATNQEDRGEAWSHDERNKKTGAIREGQKRKSSRIADLSSFCSTDSI